LAFKNRKSKKLLSMLTNWYEKANEEQKAEILTWTISQ